MRYIFLLILIFLFFPQVGFSKEILGFAKIIDGDTMVINFKKIRLEGIDAPEAKQKCEKNFKKYYCGRKSTKELKKKISDFLINCSISGVDKYKRYLGTCFKKKTNLNKWMVRNGYAVAYKRYSGKYIVDEKYAREKRLGLWSGTFIRPEKWRKLN